MSTSSTAGSAGSSAPLVEASLEPGPVRWSELRAWQGEVVEVVEVVEEIADVPGGPGTDGGAQAPPVPRSPQELSWPCTCGALVAFEQNTCPTCASPFLGDLRNENDGRHRSGGAFGQQWSESRGFRFMVAGGIAFLVAVVIPVLLALIA